MFCEGGIKTNNSWAADATGRRLLATGNPDVQASRLLLAGLLKMAPSHTVYKSF